VAAIDGARPIGIPHRNAARGEKCGRPDAEAATVAVGSALARAPLVRTLNDGPSKATSTVPFVSVRYVSRAIDWSRSIVDGAGCP